MKKFFVFSFLFLSSFSYSSGYERRQDKPLSSISSQSSENKLIKKHISLISLNPLSNFFRKLFRKKIICINNFANVMALYITRNDIVANCSKTNSPCSKATPVEIEVIARDLENDVLTYNYTVTAGRITGQGAKVTWDLSGVAPGTYTITVGVDDGCGVCGKTKSQTVKVIEYPN